MWRRFLEFVPKSCSCSIPKQQRKLWLLIRVEPQLDGADQPFSFVLRRCVQSVIEVNGEDRRG
jgi:hypothetical protein